MEYFYLVHVNNSGVKVLTSLNPNLALENKKSFVSGGEEYKLPSHINNNKNNN